LTLHAVSCGRRRFAAILASLCAFCASAGAEGQEARVVLVGGDEPARFTPRLRAELEAVGFAVAEVAATAGAVPVAALEDAARREKAVAAIRCSAASESVDVWIADRVTGKVVLRRVAVPPDAPDADAEVALGVIELLRASLLEVRTSHVKRGDVAPPPAVEALASPRPDEPRGEAARAEGRLFAGVFAAAAFARLSRPPAVAALVDLRLALGSLFGVALLGLVPFSAVREEEPEGEVDTRFGLVGGGVAVTLPRGRRLWKGFLEVGLTAALFRIEGIPAGGYEGHEGLLASPAPYARGGASLRVAERLRLRLDLLAGVTTAKIVVSMAGRRAAAYGEPFLGIALGAELGLL